jgi:hypothetical protein
LFAHLRVRRFVASCIAGAALCFSHSALADHIVGAGGTTLLGTARLDLACTDLIVFGTMNVDGGTIVNVRDVIVQPGGILRGGTGSITLSRNFTIVPGGQFLPEQGSVNYDTACGIGPQPEAKDIPTLGNEWLIALVALLLALAMVVLRDDRMQPRRNTIEGVEN